MPGTRLRLKAPGRATRRLRREQAAELARSRSARGDCRARDPRLLGALPGIHALNRDLFTKGPAVSARPAAGSRLRSSEALLLVPIATAMALPFGVMTAIFVSEFAPKRIGDQIRLWLDVLNGFPSIVIGIFVFTLW